MHCWDKVGLGGFREEAGELIQVKRNLVRKDPPLYLARTVAHNGTQSELLNELTAINPPPHFVASNTETFPVGVWSH